MTGRVVLLVAVDAPDASPTVRPQRGGLKLLQMLSPCPPLPRPTPSTGQSCQESSVPGAPWLFCAGQGQGSERPHRSCDRDPELRALRLAPGRGSHSLQHQMPGLGFESPQHPSTAQPSTAQPSPAQPTGSESPAQKGVLRRQTPRIRGSLNL